MTTRPINENPPLLPTEPEIEEALYSEDIDFCDEVDFPSTNLPEDLTSDPRNLSGAAVARNCSTIIADHLMSSEDAAPIPLATFDVNDDCQRMLALELNELLTETNFDAANQEAHAGSYGIEAIYDSYMTNDLLQASQNLTDPQKLELGFFMYGGAVSYTDIEGLFVDHLELFDSMVAQGLVTTTNDGLFRLNNLSLVSHQLANNETIYIFVDLPKALVANDRSYQDTAQIAGTSFVLLERLEQEFQQGKPFSGLAADFGSGSGILTLALLKLYPGISKALAIEIDSRSMNLAALNAMLNNEADRFQVVDNANEGNFTQALNGQQLDLAISNPPFNAVPKKYAKPFTDFGDGGEHGLDVTEIFLRQALPVLKPEAPFILYSVLTLGSDCHFHATHLLKKMGNGLSVSYERLNLLNLDYPAQEYAQILAGWLVNHSDAGKGTSRQADLNKDIAQELTKSDITYLTPEIWTVTKNTESTELKVKQASTPMPAFEAYDNAGESEPMALVGMDGTLNIRPPLDKREIPTLHLINTGGERIASQSGGLFISKQQVGHIFDLLQNQILSDSCFKRDANGNLILDQKAVVGCAQKILAGIKE